VLAEFTPVLYCPDDANLILQMREAEAPPPPPDPEPFIGRAEVLRRMTALIRPDSGIRAVLLTGGCGIGKTACAEEFAGGVDGAFDAVVRFTPGQQNPDAAASPDDGIDRGGRPEELADLRGRRLLVVIDGLDAVLTEDGRLPRSWQTAIDALTGPDSPARTVLTSRRRVESLARCAGCEVVGLGSLSWDETLLLAGELPRLGGLRKAMQAADVLGQGYLVIQAILGLEATERHPELMAALDAMSLDLPNFMEASTLLGRLAAGTEGTYGPAWDRAVQACAWAHGVIEALTLPALVLARLFAVFGTGSRTDLSALERCWETWWGACADTAMPPVAPLVDRLLATNVIIDVPGADSGVCYELSPPIQPWLTARESTPTEIQAAVRLLRVQDEQAVSSRQQGPEARDDGPVSLAFAAVEMFENGRKEDGLRLLYALAEAGISVPGEDRVWQPAERLAEMAGTAREELLAAMARNIAQRLRGSDRRLRALQEDLLLAQEHPDLAAMAGLSVMDAALDSNDLEAYASVAGRVEALIGDDPVLRLRARYEHARLLAKSGEIIDSLAEAAIVISALQQPDPAADPFTTVTRSVVLEGALELAANACGILRQHEDQLRYADQLILLRTRRGAPASEMVQPYLQRAHTLDRGGPAQDRLHR
jgi:hypothetical protein